VIGSEPSASFFRCDSGYLSDKSLDQIYTTDLDLSKFTPEQIARAEKLAAEIEKDSRFENHEEKEGDKLTALNDHYQCCASTEKDFKDLDYLAELLLQSVASSDLLKMFNEIDGEDPLEDELDKLSDLASQPLIMNLLV
jgi:LsmAD domain